MLGVLCACETAASQCTPLRAFLDAEMKLAASDNRHRDATRRQFGEAREHFGGAMVLDTNADVGIQQMARHGLQPGTFLPWCICAIHQKNSR